MLSNVCFSHVVNVDTYNLFRRILFFRFHSTWLKNGFELSIHATTQNNSKTWHFSTYFKRFLENWSVLGKILELMIQFNKVFDYKVVNSCWNTCTKNTFQKLFFSKVIFSVYTLQFFVAVEAITKIDFNYF